MKQKGGRLLLHYLTLSYIVLDCLTLMKQKGGRLLRVGRLIEVSISPSVCDALRKIQLGSGDRQKRKVDQIVQNFKGLFNYILCLQPPPSSARERGRAFSSGRGEGKIRKLTDPKI